MAKFKTIVRVGVGNPWETTFEAEVNELLTDGYKILNVNGGVRNYPEGSSDLVYQAFLIKE